MTKTGQFIGVGVGPGDPELLTLKAYRLISQAKVVAYLCNKTSHSQAKSIAQLAFAEHSDCIEIAIEMPMSTNRGAANHAYNKGAEEIRQYLQKGMDVVFLCEGDPLFFGSFAYLLLRLQADFSCQVVPGIASINAAAAVLQKPLVLQSESFAVISGRHSEVAIINALETHDNVVIMKAGQARPKILSCLTQTNRLDDSQYLEYIGRENEQVIADVSQLTAEAGPYFSLFVVSRKAP